MTQKISQSHLEKILKSIYFSAFLYPLDRIQSVKQIQNTYANQAITTSKNIITQCTHYGFRSLFRGVFVYLARGSLLLAGVHSVNTFQQSITIQNKFIKLGVLSSIVGFLYTAIYPLENIKMRMCSEVERQRFYESGRQCIRKVKKQQGYKSLYKGFFLGLLHFSAQVGCSFYLLNQFFNFKAAYIPEDNTQKIAVFILVSQVLLYPFDSLKKIVQMNGAFGHTLDNYSYKRAFVRNYSLLYRGFSIKFLSYLSFYGLHLYFRDTNPYLNRN